MPLPGPIHHWLSMALHIKSNSTTRLSHSPSTHQILQSRTPNHLLSQHDFCPFLIFHAFLPLGLFIPTWSSDVNTDNHFFCNNFLLLPGLGQSFLSLCSHSNQPPALPCLLWEFPLFWFLPVILCSHTLPLFATNYWVHVVLDLHQRQKKNTLCSKIYSLKLIKIKRPSELTIGKRAN